PPYPGGGRRPGGRMRRPALAVFCRAPQKTARRPARRIRVARSGLSYKAPQVQWSQVPVNAESITTLSDLFICPHKKKLENWSEACPDGKIHASVSSIRARKQKHLFWLHADKPESHEWVVSAI